MEGLATSNPTKKALEKTKTKYKLRNMIHYIYFFNNFHKKTTKNILTKTVAKVGLTIQPETNYSTIDFRFSQSKVLNSYNLSYFLSIESSTPLNLLAFINLYRLVFKDKLISSFPNTPNNNHCD